MKSGPAVKSALRPLLFRIFLLLAALAPCGASAAQSDAPWREVEPGLQLGVFLNADGDDAVAIDALRIDPSFFLFSLHSAGEGKSPLRTLSEWAEQEDLALAINAGMYLPDRKTGTGYTRYGNYVNNPRIHSKFGAFFVARPDSPELAPAAVLDRERDPWKELLPRYGLIIQNYRLIDANGRALWLPGGPAHSIAAVGQDAEGKILFIHCRTPMTGQDFAASLLRLPLGLRSLMYVEGGFQAGMLVRSPNLQRLWSGYSVAGFLHLRESGGALLPNVLGARRRGAPEASDN
jgi:hypothetical protein